jgi:hypothetical protein
LGPKLSSSKDAPLPVDVLLTYHWPGSITQLCDLQSLPSDVWDGDQVAPLKDVTTTLKPRYHFASQSGIFWERPPIAWDDGQETRLTRFISLGEFAKANAGKKQRVIFLYSGLTLLRKLLVVLCIQFIPFTPEYSPETKKCHARSICDRCPPFRKHLEENIVGDTGKLYLELSRGPCQTNTIRFVLTTDNSWVHDWTPMQTIIQLFAANAIRLVSVFWNLNLIFPWFTHLNLAFGSWLSRKGQAARRLCMSKM